MSVLLTYLCPDCNGYGRIDDDNRHPHDPAHEDSACDRCDESGVVQLTRDEGERLGLHRWADTTEGRNACRQRLPRVDPLVSLARWRGKAARGIRLYDGDWRTTEYGWLRIRFATRPSAGMARLRMVEAAIRCDVACRDAVEAWRATA